MSNSTLIEYTQISPNKNSPRNHTIDRITPHCYVGQVTAEGMAAWLCTQTAQASANYCIDKNGKVALLVDEADRSWCSSNAANDHRAVTIECASATYQPYAINQCVYDKLIELMADICKRNGKTKLLWFGDREKTLTYTPKENEMVITVHRWFANKACPGDYIYNRLGQITDAVNAILGNTETVPDTKIKEQDNAKTIWTFLKSKGLNDFAVAGIMGNLRAESALSPVNMQDSFEPKLNYNDTAYTKAVDNGTYTNFVHDKCGYGLAQWTYWSRKQSLLTYAHNQGKSIGDLQMQLDFLWREMQGYEVLMAKLNRVNNVRDASNAFLMEFEKPGDMGQSQQDRRFKFSQEYYDTFAVKEEKKEEQHYYKIQTGAFSNKDNAERQIKKLAEHGISAILVYKNGIYKVQAGAYTVKENAKKKLEEVHKAGFVDAFITE